jgi:hypothetical protein
MQQHGNSNSINEKDSIMRNLLFLSLMVIFTIMAGGATAQVQTNYIIVKTGNGEVASFNPAAVSSQYIENGNWVFALKDAQVFTYPLADVQPFTTEVRNSNSGTRTEPVAPDATWNVYDDGNGLIIVNPGGEVGRYEVYHLSGTLVKSGYEAGSRAAVSVPSGGVYIVKAGLGAKKAVKK